MPDRPVFWRRVITYNGDQPAISYTEDFTAWADARRLTETSARFFIRYRAGIGPDTHRIVWDGAIWTITSAPHDKKKMMITIDSDLSQLVEVTHMLSTEREFIEGMPVVRPPSS